MMAEHDNDGAKRLWAALGLVVFLLALLAFFIGPQRLWEGFFATPVAPDPATPTQKLPKGEVTAKVAAKAARCSARRHMPTLF